MRGAIAGDIAGSRFERSIWTEASFETARCIGFDSQPARDNSIGEYSTSFGLFHAECVITDDTVLTLAMMDWLLHGGELGDKLRRLRVQHGELRWASSRTVGMSSLTHATGATRMAAPFPMSSPRWAIHEVAIGVRALFR